MEAVARERPFWSRAGSNGQGMKDHRMHTKWSLRVLTGAVVAISLVQAGCSVLFPFTASVEEKEEVRLPPPSPRAISTTTNSMTS